MSRRWATYSWISPFTPFAQEGGTAGVSVCYTKIAEVEEPDLKGTRKYPNDMAFDRYP